VLYPTRITHFERNMESIVPEQATDETSLPTLHRAESGDAIGFCFGDADTVNRIRFSADTAMLVSASADTTARVWETANRCLLQRFGGLGLDMLWALDFSPDDRLLIGKTEGGRLLTWDSRTGELLRDFAMPADTGESLAASSDATVAVVRESIKGQAGVVRLWDTVKRCAVTLLENRDLIVDRAVFSPDDRLLASHENNGTIRIWNAGDGRQISATPTTAAEIQLLRFSPDSRYLLVGSISNDDPERPSVLIDTATGRVLCKLEIGSADILSASFNPSGTLLATGSNDAEARIWECPSGKLVTRLPTHPQTVSWVEFSPDGKLLVTACWRSTIVQVWSVIGWQRITRMRNPPAHLVERATFSPDSRLLVAASDRADELVVWDAHTGETLAGIDIPNADYWDVNFSHDGKRLGIMCRSSSATRPSGGPVILEVPDLTSPVPAWVPDFLRFLLQRTIDDNGRRRVLTPSEWEALRDQVTTAASADQSRYGELARWFMAPADQRPVRPGETMTRGELADRLVTPDADPVQLERALAFDPANVLAHLALARFAENPQATAFLRRWAHERLPTRPGLDLQRRIEALDALIDDVKPDTP
jgi:WD40 repeat protein